MLAGHVAARGCLAALLSTAQHLLNTVILPLRWQHNFDDGVVLVWSKRAAVARFCQHALQLPCLPAASHHCCQCVAQQPRSS